MTDKNLERLLSLARVVAMQASLKVISGRPSLRKVEHNLPRDVKIAADRAMESFIIGKIRQASTYPILSEESGFQGKPSGEGYRWIVDPLDGSLNFLRQIPICCISIALWKLTEPILGVVYDFNRNEIFTALVGKGAWLNGNSIHVSKVAEKSDAILCTGFPINTDFSEKSLMKFIKNVLSYKKVRLLGSAALSLAYVSCGRADFYHEDDIKIWDVAAGLALVKAAGGNIRFENWSSKNTLNVKASNPFLLKDI